MYTLDSSVRDLMISIRSSNALIKNKINTIRDLLSTDIKDIVNFRNVGKKSISEILDVCEKLREELYAEYESEKTGYLYWKAKNDYWDYGILLKDGTVIHAKELLEKDFGWIDMLIEIESDHDFLPFGKKPTHFSGCRNRISIRKEFIAAICEIES